MMVYWNSPDYSLAAYLKGFESTLPTLIFRERENAPCKWKMSGVMILSKTQIQLTPNELTNRMFWGYNRHITNGMFKMHNLGKFSIGTPPRNITTIKLRNVE